MAEEESLKVLMFDPVKCQQLSVEKKRELVHEMSKQPDSAIEMLQAWSRHDILQVLCAELGKERKYTGLTKSKMIEQLLRIVYENKSVEHGNENGERNQKRQRKCEDVFVDSSVYCENSACKARLNSDETFCRRCSCCICHRYDDNKDPSLWLICNSEPPFDGLSCSMSCHLECAFGHEKSGIMMDRKDKSLDGSFYCVSCGKVNDLLGSWRKQLAEARDTRRVDVLCYRLSLVQKMLDGTKRYEKLCSIIGEAVTKLEEDMGPLTGVPVKKARGIVNRLSSGPEVQTLCALAIESLDSIHSSPLSSTPEKVNLKSPSMEKSHSPVTNCSSLSNPSSVEDETNDISFSDRGRGVVQSAKPTSHETGLPLTPCKLEKLTNKRGNKSKLSEKNIQEPQTGNSSKKINQEIQDKESISTISNEDFEYHVKIIRWLECEGHIEKTFRRKFLSWYSMKATPRQVRVVNVYIKTFIEDPSSLAGQLMDTFSFSTLPPGFCFKLWH